MAEKNNRLKKITCPKCHEALLIKAFVWDTNRDEVRMAVQCLGCGGEVMIIFKKNAKPQFLDI